MVRSLGPRVGAPDPLCMAILDGHVKHRARLAERFPGAFEPIPTPGDVVMTSGQVWVSLLAAGEVHEADGWHATVDCEADDRYWLIPATGRMFECDAEGVPL